MSGWPAPTPSRPATLHARRSSNPRDQAVRRCARAFPVLGSASCKRTCNSRNVPTRCEPSLADRGDATGHVSIPRMFERLLSGPAACIHPPFWQDQPTDLAVSMPSDRLASDACRNHRWCRRKPAIPRYTAAVSAALSRLLVACPPGPVIPTNPDADFKSLRLPRGEPSTGGGEGWNPAACAVTLMPRASSFAIP